VLLLLLLLLLLHARYKALSYLEAVLAKHVGSFKEGTSHAGDAALLAADDVSPDLRTAVVYRAMQRGTYLPRQS
jgi:hypothetical protein